MTNLNFVISALLLLITRILNAQTIEMADSMRANGKIYVVVALVVILFIGFFIDQTEVNKSNF